MRTWSDCLWKTEFPGIFRIFDLFSTEERSLEASPVCQTSRKQTQMYPSIGFKHSVAKRST
jgi:hypothetical protein